MFYVIYKTTNLLNGKFYIGKHKTKNINDGYIGSGKLLRRAVKKHGSDNFYKEILHVCKNEKHMNVLEKILIVPDRDINYNLCAGGYGGFSFINSSPSLVAKRDNVVHKRAGRLAANKNGANAKGSNSHLEKLKDPNYRDQWKQKVEMGKRNRQRHDCPYCNMKQLDPGNYSKHIKAKHT